MCGAMSALTAAAIEGAGPTGTVLSAPLLMKPWASSVPIVRMTVLILAGTSWRNSCQFRSSMEREDGCCARTAPGYDARTRVVMMRNRDGMRISLEKFCEARADSILY